MEKKLLSLFDYQRFEQSPVLARIISDTHSRCARALSDDDLELVCAAGEIEIENCKDNGESF